MKKSRIVISYILENIVFVWGVTAVAFIVAQFITPIFAGGILADIQPMLSAESFENVTKGINFDVMLQNIGLVFGGMTAIVAVSMVLACINIVRFEPLKIFNNQY